MIEDIAAHITTKEYERLKKLDENVQKEIAELKRMDEEICSIESPLSPQRSEILHGIDWLENLYK